MPACQIICNRDLLSCISDATDCTALLEFVTSSPIDINNQSMECHKTCMLPIIVTGLGQCCVCRPGYIGVICTHLNLCDAVDFAVQKATQVSMMSTVLSIFILIVCRVGTLFGT